MADHQTRDRVLEFRGPLAELADRGQERAGKVGPDARDASQLPLDCLELTAADELAGRPAVTGEEHDEMGVEPVARPGLGVDEVVAGVGQ